jgi:KTSC domain-containing protein
VRREPVSSSNLQSVGYDPQNRILEIAFHGNGVYQYEDVNHSIYTELMAAPSKGRYFDERIRDRYAWRRVDEGGAP